MEMENEKRTESPQEPQLEGAVHDAPTPRRRHRRPSHRNTAAASAEPAAQTESAAAAPAELATQPEHAARGTAAAEQPASDAVAPVTPVATAAAPAPRDLAAQPAQKSAAEPAAQPMPAAEPSGSKPAAQQKPVAEPSGSKSAVQQKPAAETSGSKPAVQQKGASAPQRPAAPERQKGAAPQRPAGAASEHRGAAPQKPAGQNDRKAAALRNAAANDRRTNTPRRAAEPPKRPATPQKRPAERSTGDGGWTWRGYLCRLSVVILGTALTLLGAGLIGRWQEFRQVRGAMQAVYEELTANRAAVGMACRGLMRGGQELQPRAGAADNRLSATSPTTNPMTLRAPVTPVLRDEAWQVLCASGVMASVRDGELLRDMAGCYADVDRFARQIEKGWAPDPAAAQLGKGAAGRIDRVLRQLEGKYGFRQ
ncbi:hypothetical protein [uncultured Alistipes sp.]|uniref:hypothetical protein n=1 Tax=uncultured Alistipes sp. TaxID=538949 RepID=UPI0028058723|nr:hypothetical protein [uncultured Alistipes sp.]